MNTWDFWARLYRLVRKPWPLSVIMKNERQQLQHLISQLDQRIDIVIDLGCGTGDSAGMLANACSIGVDKSGEMLKRAKSRYDFVIKADASLLPLRSLSNSLITAVGLSEYIGRIELFFKNSAFLIPRGSYLLITSSPRNFYTILRFVLGVAIYPREARRIILIAQGKGFCLISQKSFFSQDAFLFKRT